MNDPHSWYPFSAFKFFLIIFRIHFTKELSAIIMIKNELGGRPVRLKVNWCQKSAKALCRKHYGVHLFCQRDTCKDGYSDTMGIGIIVLYFCQKPLKIADFITLLRKAPPLTRQKAGPETVPFCFLGVIWVWLSLIYWLPLFYWSNRSITILQGNLQRISRFFSCSHVIVMWAF